MRLTLFAALFALTLSAQSLPTGVRQTATLAGVTQYDFPNGFHAVLIPDPSAPRITVNMVYLVGSRHEGYGETGMAHLLEHLNFIRTTGNRDIKKELVDHAGASNWNGTTSYDRTNYFETFTASDENLRWALGLEADRMLNTRMEKAILDTEMTVVRNEFERGENSPGRILEERVLSTAYLWHNYGKSTIGSRADIEKVPIDRLAAFYRKYYQPDNAILVLAGQFDTSKALAEIAGTIGALPRPTRKLDEPYTVEPVQDGERTIELRRVGNGQQVMMAWHVPAMAHPDSAALEVLGGILNGANGTGRLTKALVDNKKALTARFGNEEMHDPGWALAAATLNDQQSLPEVRDLINSTIAGVVKEPPSADEVERVKTRITRQMEQSIGNSQRLALSFTDIIGAGDWRLFFLNYDQIKAVTPEDVVRVAKTYFKDSNRTVGYFIPTPAPERAEVPAAPDTDAIFRDYKTTLKSAEVDAFDPSPEAIEKHITRVTLPNGMRLALLPRPDKNKETSATLQLRFGDEKNLAGKQAAAQLAGSLLMRGTKNKSRQAIQEELDKLNARVGVSGGGGGGGGRGGGGRGGVATSVSSAGASVVAPRENFLAALRLAIEILREPAFPENDFEQIRTQEIGAIDRTRPEPSNLAVESLASHMSPYPRSDIRHVRSIDERIEDLKKVTLDDVKKFHSDFYGASDALMVVSGDFDPPAVQKAITDLLGSWKTPAPYVRLQSTYQKVAPVNQAIETPDKENAQFEGGLSIPMSDADPDYPALVMANYVFGGTISSRLADRVRNKEGLSYGVNSGFTAPAFGNNASFRVAAIANPQNTPRVENAFFDELRKALDGGFTAEEVDAAKKSFLDARRIQRADPNGAASLILLRETDKRTLLWDAQMDAKLGALTADQVSAAFRKYISPAAVSIVKAGDFRRAGVYQK
jgi:zinc protease